MPTDTTPDPRDMERMPEDKQIPQAKRDIAGKPDIERRPPLPDKPKPMAADIEDEEADPVVESGRTDTPKGERG